MPLKHDSLVVRSVKYSSKVLSVFVNTCISNSCRENDQNVTKKLVHFLDKVKKLPLLCPVTVVQLNIFSCKLTFRIFLHSLTK